MPLAVQVANSTVPSAMTLMDHISWNDDLNGPYFLKFQNFRNMTLPVGKYCRLAHSKYTLHSKFDVLQWLLSQIFFYYLLFTCCVFQLYALKLNEMAIMHWFPARVQHRHHIYQYVFVSQHSILHHNAVWVFSGHHTNNVWVSAQRYSKLNYFRAVD